MIDWVISSGQPATIIITTPTIQLLLHLHLRSRPLSHHLALVIAAAGAIGGACHYCWTLMIITTTATNNTVVVVITAIVVVVVIIIIINSQTTSSSHGHEESGVLEEELRGNRRDRAGTYPVSYVERETRDRDRGFQTENGARIWDSGGFGILSPSLTSKPQLSSLRPVHRILCKPNPPFCFCSFII